MTYSRYAIEDTLIDDLIAGYQPDYSLEQPFYFSPENFEEEFVHLFSRQWQFTDHISRIPDKGTISCSKLREKRSSSCAATATLSMLISMFAATADRGSAWHPKVTSNE